MREVAIKTARVFVVYAVAALPVLACLGVGLKVLFWYYLKDDEVHVEPRERRGARRTGKRSHGHSEGGGVLATTSIDYQSAVMSAGTDDEDESDEEEARQLEARRAEKGRSVEKHEKKKGGRGRASCRHDGPISNMTAL